MDKSISAADANRMFSRLLREVRNGKSYVVTSHGKPVARIVPEATGDGAQAVARSALLSRLKSQRAIKTERWTRDELYERGK